MTIIEDLKDKIKQERLSREALSGNDPMLLIFAKKDQETLENLIFFASPNAFLNIIEKLGENNPKSQIYQSQDHQERYLSFLVNLAISLRSFLPRWNLQNKERHGESALTDAQVAAAGEKIHQLAVDFAASAPSATDKFLAGRRVETTARLDAEQVKNPQDEANRLVGNTVDEYITNLSAAISHSNFRRIAEMRNTGKTFSELSNDHASFLNYAMWLGASFVTCNPPLVARAWAVQPEIWDPIASQLITSHPNLDADMLARLMTLEVVSAQMRLMRPVFLLTEGQMGCICLQVNPNKHDHAQTMISDAQFYYQHLKARFGGGVPNVVFKLPGTHAALETCRQLTMQGIGVVITVNFGMFQHLPFLEAMQDGETIFCCLVEMTGRLAYPVRDELMGKLEELSAYNIDEAKAREAAAWAGVAVAKRLYKLMKEKVYDLRRFKPLTASSRVYEGFGYQNLPNPLIDITEVMGATILSIFPFARRYLDSMTEVVLNPKQIEEPVPNHVLETLAHSEIFKQAYYVSDPRWISHEELRFKPDYILNLEDEAAVAAWAPINATLTEFSKAYNSFIERLAERKKQLLG